MNIYYRIAAATVALGVAVAIPAFADPAPAAAPATVAAVTPKATTTHHSAHHVKTSHKAVKKVKATIPAGPGTAGPGKP